MKPINVMGMTKAIQERIFVRRNLGGRGQMFVLVRYGNVTRLSRLGDPVVPVDRSGRWAG